MIGGSYYNDNEQFVCEWLRNLIAAGHLPAGDVDERSILEVSADDLKGYAQVHLFAGVGGWPLALRLAGWPDDRPAWSGSCPCQPLSSAGKRRGHADKRHLWPAFHRLIAKCGPPVVLGEQTAGPLGREWLAAVRADLEHLGYACGAADLSAAGVGAPHIRQRLFWVAESSSQPGRQGTEREDGKETGNGSGVGDTERSQRRSIDGPRQDGCDGQDIGREKAHLQLGARGQICARANPWADSVLLQCADGKARPAPQSQSGIHPLAYGVPNRVGRLRAYGNAIVPQVAAAFVQAYLEATP